MNYQILLATVILTLLLGGCTTDPGPIPNPATVVVHGLPVSPPGTRYTLWVSSFLTAEKRNRTGHGDELYTPLGSFIVVGRTDSIPRSGSGAPMEFIVPDSVNTNLLADAIVTVEREGETPEEPGARLLAGPFTGDEIRANAELRFNDDDAFGGLLDTAGGVAALDSPTGEAPTDSGARGVWFIDYQRNGAGEIIGVVPGLRLPVLPAGEVGEGWCYAGWLMQVVDSVTTLYTPLGRFLDPAAADSSGAGPGAGAGNPYPYPGEDFVSGGGARRVNDGRTSVIISLDPSALVLDRPFLPILRSIPLPEFFPGQERFLLPLESIGTTVQVSIRRV